MSSGGRDPADSHLGYAMRSNRLVVTRQQGTAEKGWVMRSSLVGLIVLTALLAIAPAADAQSPPVLPGTQGDFAGLVDIGGRKLYLECRGRGNPTVILVAGKDSSARIWTDDLLPANPPRTMVFPTIATTTRVCAYDRPGTYAFIGQEGFISRSDPVAQPTTAMARVADLHALLRAAGVPGPYVLAGHSLGGFVARMYASTYPDEVIGLVVIDAYSEFLEPIFGPERWPRLVRLNASNKEVKSLLGYGDGEAWAFGEENDAMRRLTAASPLRPMPLAVLAHKVPFTIPADPALSQGFTSEEIEPLLFAANQAQAMLVPNARFFVASRSGHDIHQDQPALVAEAIRQVVAGVRSPDTWDELAACCRP
jgi:pimeloyl-ACP methyl ester carboxylesterase